MKRILSICICLVGMVSLCFSQEKRSEITVEQEYLTTIEDVIIAELSAADERDNKLVALQYLEAAIDAGRFSPNMQDSLNSLAGEGLFNQSRTAGRLINNYPDIRAKSCELLGKINTQESKDTLLKVILADNEPMVTTAAVQALGNISVEEVDDSIATIAWSQKKFATVNPTSSLALEVIIAYEKLSGRVKDTTPMIQSISEIATNYNYVTPVRTRALELLKTISNSQQEK